MLLAGAVAALVAAAAIVLALQKDGDDGQPAAPDRPARPAPDDAAAAVTVPDGLSAVESAAGVQLDWDGGKSDAYVVLMLSETAAPRVLPAESGSSLLVPATSLAAGDAYCFAVAYVDALEAASPSEEAFSPPTCVRGASEDTVRLE